MNVLERDSLVVREDAANMHKPTVSNQSSFRFFSSSTINASSGAITPVPDNPDDSHSLYFLRSASTKKNRPALTHHKSLDNVTMFGRVGGREYVNVTPVPPIIQAPQSPNALYETVFEVATKRMATLDYLRRA